MLKQIAKIKITILLLLLFLLITQLPISIGKVSKSTPDPIFIDSFEDNVNTDKTLTSPFYKETINSTKGITFVQGKIGKGVHLDSLSSYICYSNKYFNPDEGTLRVYYKPDPNLYDFYNTRQPEWKDLGSYKPPYSGLMFDSPGHLSAFKGSFAVNLIFSGDKNNKNILISFGSFSGTNWSYAIYETNNNFILSSDKFYDFAFVWSKKEGKLKIYIDGSLKSTADYNTQINNSELFFIGHVPFSNYWPYGPHSLIGTYDELRIYNYALNDFSDTPPNPPSPPNPPTPPSPPNPPTPPTPPPPPSPPTPPSPTTTSDKITIILQINNPYMIVNGIKKEIDPGRGTVPVIVKGRTLVQIRAIIEELGGTIEWDGNERKVTIKLKNIQIELWIDKKNAKVNGVSKELDVPPQIINGRTMLPLRFVTEEFGCTVDWDGNKKTITITYIKTVPQETDKIVAQDEKIIGPSGGEINLSDGTKLSIPPNSFNENTKISLSSITNPSTLGTDSKGFEIKGLQNLKGEITLNFTVEKDLSNDEISVFGYNPQNDNVFNVSSNYESSTGIVSVKLNPNSLPTIYSTSYSDCGSSLLSFTSPKKTQGIIERFKILFEVTHPYLPQNEEFLIQMPYYGQIGNGCWTTSTIMLIRGYSGPQAGEPFGSILSYMKVDDNDYGVGLLNFTELLPSYIHLHTNGKNVIWRGFTSFQHIQWEILRQIEAGRHPILFKYFGHVVLIIGFRNYGRELIIHDPQNINPPNETNGTMYTIKSENWLKDRMSFTRANQIMWVPEALTTSKTLQTIECAGGDESGGNPYGEILFYNINPKITDKDRQKVPIATLRLKPSISFGYRWVNKDESVDVIPSETIGLKMKLPIWNASFEDKNLTVKTQINADVTNKVFYNEKNIFVKRTSYNSEARSTYEIDIPLEDVRNVAYGDAQGKQKTTIFIDLCEGNTVKDSFVIDANLSLIPKVVSVEPNTGKAGDTITIKGYAFGKKLSPKSRVTIDGIDAKILEWSDSLI
jgi:hypothetical protein